MNKNINYLKAYINEINYLLNQALIGEYSWRVDTDDPVGRYVYEPEIYASYLDLPKNKQIGFCYWNGQLAKCYLLLAQENERLQKHQNAAINYYKAWLHGVELPLKQTATPLEKERSFKTDPPHLSNGLCLLFGIGCAPDYIKARVIFKQLAKDNRHARFLLGFLYENGLGVNQNFGKAAELYKQSKIRLAEYRLGLLYANGQGVRRCNYLARKHFQKAALHALPQALNKLSAMYARGQGFVFAHPHKAEHLSELASVQKLKINKPKKNPLLFFSKEKRRSEHAPLQASLALNG